MKSLFLKIAASLYGVGIRLRHLLFDWGILRSSSYDIPIICVGNITVGGTGKTPAVEMLIERYCKSYKIAVLSRGYGRRTKGYLEVECDDSYLKVGDEPLQIKRKYPSIKVVVCERRTEGIERIMAEHEDITMIIMDDGFQHRYVKPFINIIMVDATRPVQEDRLLPVGQLRDTVGSLERAHYFIVTKCPRTINAAEKLVHRKWLRQKPSQRVFFSSIINGAIRPIFAEGEGIPAEGSEVIAMSGIGNNEVFNASLARRFYVRATIDHDDHHAYVMRDLQLMQSALAKYPNAVIITTEKDAVKLFNVQKMPAEMRARMYYESVGMEFLGDDYDEFFRRIDNDLKNYNNEMFIRGC